MKRHIAYFKYIWLHKWYVFQACIKLRVPLWRAIIHDWTKYTPAEWTGYANKFFNYDGSKRTGNEEDLIYRAQVEKKFLKAWHHHEAHNPHHWGYWLTLTRKENRYAINAMGDGYPLYLYDFVENIRFEHEFPDITPEKITGGFGGSGNRIYDGLLEIRDRLNRDSKVVALEMPETYAREMVADWIGAGKAISGKSDLREWYEKNREDIILHSHTRIFVEYLIGISSLF